MTQDKKDELIINKQNEIENTKNLVVVKEQLKQGLENTLNENLIGFSIKTNSFYVTVNSANHNEELKIAIQSVLVKVDAEIEQIKLEIAQPLLDLEAQLLELQNTTIQ